MSPEDARADRQRLPALDRAAGEDGPSATHVAILALLGAAFILHAVHYWFLIDDAFISFRYARNLVDGAGLVFNPGREPVEGYSNLLWVLIMAGGMWLGMPPELFSRVVGVAAGLALLVVTWRLALRTLAGRASSASWSLVPIVLLVTNRSVAAWATGGLETRLFTTLVVMAVWLAARDVEEERRVPGALVPLALLMLTRVDGFVPAGAILTALLFYPHRGQRQAMSILAVGTGLTLLGLTAFRLGYYGQALANTFYVKATDPLVAEGFRYVGLAVTHYGLALQLLLAVLGTAALFRRPAVGIAASVLGAHLAYVIGVGGDHFELRFLDVAWPLAAVLATLGCTRLAEFRPRRAAVVSWCATAGAILAWNAAPAVRGFPSSFEVTSVEEEAALCSRWDNVGRWFRENAAPDEVIAVRPAGVIPYRSGLRTMDMLGLNDEAIARRDAPDLYRVVGHRKTATWDDILVRYRSDYIIGHPAIRESPDAWSTWEPRIVEAGGRRFAVAPALARIGAFWLRFDVVSEEAVGRDGALDFDRFRTRIRPNVVASASEEPSSRASGAASLNPSPVGERPPARAPSVETSPVPRR